MASVAAGAKTVLPEQSVVVPGFNEQVARERLLESDMQPLEGIWYYPNEDMTKDGVCELCGHVNDCKHPNAQKESGMGWGEDDNYKIKSVDNKYHLWLYSQRSKVTLVSPLECVATLNKDATSLTFEPPHWDVKVRVNFARFLPTLFRGVSIIPHVEQERLPVGFKKIFPADGNGNKFNKVRYL